MNLFIKLLGTGVSLLAGFAGAKLVDTLWEKSTGSKPPTGNEDDVPTTLHHALAFALISASVVRFPLGRSRVWTASCPASPRRHASRRGNCASTRDFIQPAATVA